MEGMGHVLFMDWILKPALTFGLPALLIGYFGARTFGKRAFWLLAGASLVFIPFEFSILIRRLDLYFLSNTILAGLCFAGIPMLAGLLLGVGKFSRVSMSPTEPPKQ